MVAAVARAAPVAIIVAPPTAAVGDTVTLESQITDPGEGDLAYAWHQASGPPVVLSTRTEHTTRFVVPEAAAGTRLVFELVVSDRLTSSQPASASISVAGSNRPNNAPIAVAVDSVTVLGGASVRLDGSGSYDPDGEVLTYNWQQVSGDKVTLTGADTAKATLTAPKASRVVRLTILLTVTDLQGATGSAEVLVTVEPAGCGCNAAELPGMGLVFAVAIGWRLRASRRRGYRCATISP